MTPLRSSRFDYLFSHPPNTLSQLTGVFIEGKVSADPEKKTGTPALQGRESVPTSHLGRGRAPYNPPTDTKMNDPTDNNQPPKIDKRTRYDRTRKRVNLSFSVDEYRLIEKAAREMGKTRSETVIDLVTGEKRKRRVTVPAIYIKQLVLSLIPDIEV